MNESELSGDVIGAAMEVHRVLGPGLLESAYERALEHELHLRGFAVERQLAVPLAYKGQSLGDAFRLDLLVEHRLVVEIKAVEVLLPVHESQLLTYLRLAEKRFGLLLNFNVRSLKDGVKRVVNGF